MEGTSPHDLLMQRLLVTWGVRRELAPLPGAGWGVAEDGCRFPSACGRRREQERETDELGRPLVQFACPPSTHQDGGHAIEVPGRPGPSGTVTSFSLFARPRSVTEEEKQAGEDRPLSAPALRFVGEWRAATRLRGRQR